MAAELAAGDVGSSESSQSSRGVASSVTMIRVPVVADWCRASRPGAAEEEDAEGASEPVALEG